MINSVKLSNRRLTKSLKTGVELETKKLRLCTPLSLGHIRKPECLFSWWENPSGRGVRTQVFLSPTLVLIQEVLFATQLWNLNPEKILLTYLTNQCAFIQNFCFWKVRSGYRFVNWRSYLISYSSVTCNVTVTHDECVVECTLVLMH